MIVHYLLLRLFFFGGCYVAMPGGRFPSSVLVIAFAALLVAIFLLLKHGALLD